VKLKMSGYQEAVVFSERRDPTEVREELLTLDQRIGLRWALNGKESILYEDVHAIYHVWRRPENSSNVKIEGSSHLIAQIAPEVLGRDLVQYITEKYITEKCAASTMKPRL